MIEFNKEDVIVITGGSSGFGKAICLRLNKLGATCIAIARDEKKLNRTKEEADCPERFITASKDLSDDLDSIPKFMKGLAKEHGKLRGLVHSAGDGDIMPLRGIRVSDVKKIFDINFFAGLALAKGITDKRVRAAETSIVLISSIASVLPEPGQTGYASSKGAENALTKALAVEFAAQQVRVNCVLPGFIQTDLTTRFSHVYNEDYMAKLKERYPLGSGVPEDVAGLVIFLLSDASRWITGQLISIDGGRSLI